MDDSGKTLLERLKKAPPAVAGSAEDDERKRLPTVKEFTEHAERERFRKLAMSRLPREVVRDATDAAAAGVAVPIGRGACAIDARTGMVMQAVFADGHVSYLDSDAYEVSAEPTGFDNIGTAEEERFARNRLAESLSKAEASLADVRERLQTLAEKHEPLVDEVNRLRVRNAELEEMRLRVFADRMTKRADALAADRGVLESKR